MSSVTQLIKGELYCVRFDDGQQVIATYQRKWTGNWRTPSHYFFETVRNNLCIRLEGSQLNAVHPVEPKLKAGIIACTEKLRALRAAHTREYEMLCDRSAQIEDAALAELTTQLTAASTQLSN